MIEMYGEKKPMKKMGVVKKKKDRFEKEKNKFVGEIGQVQSKKNIRRIVSTNPFRR